MGRPQVMFFYTVPRAWAQGASNTELLSQGHRLSLAEGLHTQIQQPQPYIRAIVTPDTLICFEPKASVVCHLPPMIMKNSLLLQGLCVCAALVPNHELL